MRSLAFRYLVALLSLAAAIVLRALLDPVLGDRVPFVTVFGALIVAAWFGGFAPALAAALLGYLAVDYFFIEPRAQIGLRGAAHAAELVGYLLSAALIAALGGVMHTARRRAQASEERLRAFMENSAASVFIKDESGRYVFMNPAAERLLGASRRDWFGKTDFDLLPPAAAEKIRAHDRQVLAGTGAADFELALSRPGGEHYFYSTKFPLLDALGRPMVGAVTIDVTPQRRADERLRLEQEQLRIVTDTMSVGVARCSRDLTFLWVNRRFADWLGKQPEDVIGRPMLEVVGRDAMERFRPYVDRVLSGEEVRYERLVDYPGLGRKWIGGFFAPIRDGDGAPSGWVAVISDIDERKRSEEALRVAQEQLRVILDTIPVAVLRCSRDQTYEWVNAVYAGWFAKRPEEIIGRHIAAVLGEDAMPALRPYVERVLAGEQVRYERLGSFEGLGRRWISTTLTPMFDAEGRVDGWVGIAADVHDRKTMEEALREADRRKDEFLATLAHELRNPLAPIRNAIAILTKKGPLEPELVWSREVIERQVDQMSRLVDDLLDIARISRGKLELRKQRIPLRFVIDMALETSRPHINAAGHRLSVELPETPLVVDADPARLAQVFSNLLNNASKYTERGGCVSLTARIEGAEVAVCVSDTGIGFAPEAGPSLFEPFLQGDGAQERGSGGLGIGLTLVRGVVALHGGGVEARSAGPGLGAEFVVRLPLAPAGEGERQPQATPAAAPTSGLRVLVADDNRDAADSLQRILVLYGHDVRVAYDGRSAIELGESFAPQVAVLDIGMPGANGYEVARTLRARLGARIVLVALTGWGQDADRRRAMDAGFDRHLTKPVDPGTLHGLLSEVADQRQL